MLADLHVHTARCGHATGSIQDYIDIARQRGLTEIGFSDHLPLVDRDLPGLAMKSSDLGGYVGELGRLIGRQRAEGAVDGEPAVLMGIEADYIPGTEHEVSRMLDEYEFDVVLGSVHFLGDWPFDHPDYRGRYEEVSSDDFWAAYFATLEEAARTGLFDVLAHPDLAKKFCVFPSRDPSELFESLAETAAHAGVAVEINTAGLFKPVGEIYPSRELLAACFANGVPITFGSDAHAPDEVGREFAQAVALARSVGYREAMTYEKRRPRAYALPEI